VPVLQGGVVLRALALVVSLVVIAVIVARLARAQAHPGPGVDVSAKKARSNIRA
jgi:hypothetical protein